MLLARHEKEFIKRISSVQFGSTVGRIAAPVMLLGDRGLLDWLSGQMDRKDVVLAPVAETSEIDSVVVEAPRNACVLCVSTHDELALCHEARIATQRVGRRDLSILGLKNHFYAYMRTESVRYLGVTANRPALREPEQRFAIVCLPRSGSFLLCEILESVGLGRPSEHLRPEVVFFSHFCPKDFDLVAFVALTEKLATANGVFGTKIIYDFAVSLIEHAAPSLIETLAQAVRGYHLIYLYRGDKVLQALSLHRSEQTRTYRATDQSALGLYREGSWVYDFDAIEQRYEDLLNRERAAYEWARQLPSGLTCLRYEDFEKNPIMAADCVARALGRTIQRRFEVVRNLKMRDEKTERFAQRFCEEFRERKGVPALRDHSLTQD